jgi:hypothetical protein
LGDFSGENWGKNKEKIKNIFSKKIMKKGVNSCKIYMKKKTCKNEIFSIEKIKKLTNMKEMTVF